MEQRDNQPGEEAEEEAGESWERENTHTPEDRRILRRSPDSPFGIISDLADDLRVRECPQPFQSSIQYW